MKISTENGKISNQATMRERLEIFGEVWIIDETDGFGVDFVKKMYRNVRELTKNILKSTEY